MNQTEIKAPQENKNSPKLYSLTQLEKEFKIPLRYARHLVMARHVESVLKDGRVYVTAESLKNFLSKPKQEKEAHHHKGLMKRIGPGIITGAADHDPSGIGTYSTVGAQFGLALTWLALYLLPLMTAVQETCARIGIVTGKGLSGALRKKFGRNTVFVLILLLIIANTINIGADLGGMAASFQMITGINYVFSAVFFAAVIIFSTVYLSYHTFAKYLKWLVLSLLAYIITGFIIKPDWLQVARSIVIPKVQFSTGFLMANIAIIGTTISPYLFFWQSSQEVEEERDDGTLSDRHSAIIKEELHEMRKDVFSGMSLTNIIFLFIIITTAFVLFAHGVTNIQTAEQAASALKPLAGNLAYFIFAIGIVGTGMLAIPVLAGASAYAIAELMKWHEGLNLKYKKAHGFYGIIIVSTLVGLAMNFVGINPISALYWTAVINGIIASVLLIFIFKIGNDRKIMGAHTNPGWVKIFGFIATALMIASSAAFIIASFIGQ